MKWTLREYGVFKEFDLSCCIGERLLFAIHTHCGAHEPLGGFKGWRRPRIHDLEAVQGIVPLK